MECATYYKVNKWLKRHDFTFLGTYKDSDMYIKEGTYSKYIRLQKGEEFLDFENHSINNLKELVNNWKERLKWHAHLNKDSIIEAYYRAERANLL